MNNCISIEESKRIQLDILSSVDSFCSERKIVYSLSCGSLLGAVRHSGFIPWDDDLDICMLRKDYQRFILEYPPIVDGKYKLACYERTHNWHLGYAKVYDSRTRCDDNYAEIVPIGIGIDLFPMDVVPDSEEQWMEFRKELSLKRKRISTKIIKTTHLAFLKKIGLISQKLFLLPYSLSTCVADYIKTATLYDNSNYLRVFECVLGISSQRPFPKSLFNEIVDWNFEDRTFKGFKEAGIYLSATFGDYMTLPPEEKRVPKHSYSQYWIDKV